MQVVAIYAELPRLQRRRDLFAADRTNIARKSDGRRDNLMLDWFGKKSAARVP
jgi:hypothetical protein